VVTQTLLAEIEMCYTDDLLIRAVFDLASRGKVTTFPTSQAGNVDAHIPARGLLGCIPDPLKNFVFVKPALPSAMKYFYRCGNIFCHRF
jgi:hypothetical protein